VGAIGQRGRVDPDVDVRGGGTWLDVVELQTPIGRIGAERDAVAVVDVGRGAIDGDVVDPHRHLIDAGAVGIAGAYVPDSPPEPQGELYTQLVITSALS
jgi:hypothetical protein